MRPPMSRRAPRAGVTLLELLVSLAMTAALALILGSMLETTARSATRLGTGAEPLDPLLDRLELRRWIEEIPVGVAFEGGAADLSFETLIDAPPFTTAVLTRVALGRTNGALRAVAQLPDGSPGRVAVLSAATDGLLLEYWGQPPGHERRWHAAWPAGAGLPELVRIRYDLVGRALPPLSVRPARAARQSTISLSSLPPPG